MNGLTPHLVLVQIYDNDGEVYSLIINSILWMLNQSSILLSSRAVFISLYTAWGYAMARFTTVEHAHDNFTMFRFT